MNWRDIVSAPKDGSEILIWLPAPHSRIEKVHWFEAWGNWQSGDMSEVDPIGHDFFGIGAGLPTHWMPLPAPPIC